MSGLIASYPRTPPFTVRLSELWFSVSSTKHPNIILRLITCNRRCFNRLPPAHLGLYHGGGEGFRCVSFNSALEFILRVVQEHLSHDFRACKIPPVRQLNPLGRLCVFYVIHVKFGFR